MKQCKVQRDIPCYQHSTNILLNEKEVNNITIGSILACTTHVMGIATHHDWGESSERKAWDGMDKLSDSYTIGMLLDLDEGTLSVYSNGRKLGVMKRGLAGQYCRVVSFLTSGTTQVTIKRGTVPAS